MALFSTDLVEQLQSLQAQLTRRAVGFIMLIFAAVLLLLAMLASAVVSWLIDNPERTVAREVLWQALNAGVTLMVFTLAVAAIFKFLPDVIISWRSVLGGASLTGVFLLIAHHLIPEAMIDGKSRLHPQLFFLNFK